MTNNEKHIARSLVSSCVPKKNEYTYRSWVEGIRNELFNNNENCFVDYGLYKCVIIPIDYDFVIKMPLSQCIEGNDCKKELNVYKEMVRHKFDCFFAKTEYFETINEIPVYVQEKVETYNEYCENFIEVDYSYQPYKNFIKMLKNNDIYNNNAVFCEYEEDDILFFPKEWWLEAISAYGYNKVEEFALFILNAANNEENSYILDILDDMHCDNFGFREKDGTPCILDYSMG